MENKVRRKYFAVITKQGTTRLYMKDILYFENDLRRIHVHTVHEVYSYYGSFKDLEVLVDDRFCRCHYSLMVNLDKVKSIERYVINLENGEILTVSQRKYLLTKARYLAFLSSL
jgi:DNA-binding LytR/AlgR family response regulator